MDPRRVLLFRAVARAGSLSAAARDLAMTQPAVSQQLRQLEREAGCPLLLRSSRGVSLTEAGALLLNRADAVVSQLHMAEEELSAVASLRAGRVRLWAFPSAAAALVPWALQDLQARHPGLEVTMVEGEPPEAWASVRAGEADLALVFGYDGPPPDDGQLAWIPLATEPTYLVLPPGRADAGPPTPSVRLADEPWIAGCERCRQHLVLRCRDLGFEPRLMHESDLVGRFAEGAELLRPEASTSHATESDPSAFWDSYLAQFTEIRTEFTHVEDGGGHAWLEWTSHGKLEAGRDIDYAGVSLLSFDESGRVRRFATYYDTAAFLEPSA